MRETLNKYETQKGATYAVTTHNWPTNQQKQS